MWLLYVIPAIGLMLLWTMLRQVKENTSRRRQSRVLLTRLAPPPHVWHERYFAPLGLSRENAIRAARLFSRRLGCEPTALRPDDRFNHELRSFISSESSHENTHDVEAERLVLREWIGESATNCVNSMAPANEYALADVIRWMDDPSTLPPGNCSQCGYDLRGTVSGVCSECGTSVPLRTPPDPPAKSN